MTDYQAGHYWCWNGCEWLPALYEPGWGWCVCGNEMVFKAEDVPIWVVGASLTPPATPPQVTAAKSRHSPDDVGSGPENASAGKDLPTRPGTF